MYVARFSGPGEETFALLEPRDRRRILRCVANIVLDPAPDQFTKIVQWDLGAMYTQYRDHDGYWVLYHVSGNIVWVVACGRGDAYLNVP